MWLSNYLCWFRKELHKAKGRQWLLATFGSAALLIINFILLILAGRFLTVNFQNLPPLYDMIYSFLPFTPQFELFNFAGLHVSLLLFAISISREPSRMPYIFFIASFWFFVRIASAIVTPFGAPAGNISPVPPLYVKTVWDLIKSGLESQNVLFFSGHTGLPLLGFLLFRKSIKTKFLFLPFLYLVFAYYFFVSRHALYLDIALASVFIAILVYREKMFSLKATFLSWSILMGITQIMFRGHYSIDVLGAYIMTPGIYYIGSKAFSGLEKFCANLEADFQSK